MIIAHYLKFSKLGPEHCDNQNRTGTDHPVDSTAVGLQSESRSGQRSRSAAMVGEPAVVA
jgi:hypothetical protein